MDMGYGHKRWRVKCGKIPTKVVQMTYRRWGYFIEKSDGRVCDITGGEPLFTHWAHGEYMVGSETKYPAWAHRVHVDYFLITFTIYPQFTHPNTHRAHFEYFYKVPTQIPADCWAGYIQKVPTKNPVGKFWLNYKRNP